jgi:hypothetical protein
LSANEASATAQTKPELPTLGSERLPPGAYHLDLARVKNFPLKDNGKPSTFDEVYCKLWNAKILKLPEWGWCVATFDTDAGEVTVSCETGGMFVLRILCDLIGLHKEGIDPYLAMWFYYEHDWSRDGDLLHKFFVVHDGKIVSEYFSLGQGYPRVLAIHKDNEPIWHSWPYRDTASEIYWYRKFYTDTLTGQLMVLRPDEPALFHYARAGRDLTRDVEFVTLIKGYRLLWVAVVLLAAIAFPILKPYVAFIAAALFLDLLYRCWATRKIGQ